MIEIIQQTAKTEENLESKLPKNIRQIGNPEKDFRIYMEDYVYTYLHPAQIQGMEVGIFPRLLVLLGEINHFSNRSCAFISGAIQVEEDNAPEELPELNEKTWRQIHKEIQCFFAKCEIVGWVLDIPGNTLAVTKEMEFIHRKNFVSPYQFFFLMDSKEREEAFYTWKEGKLIKKEGYFIYYEKNPQMQEYMISRREAVYGTTPVVEEVKDQAAKNYRAMMLEKKEHTYKRRAGFLSYLTSVLMVLVLCSVSVILLGNIRRMENMEQTITTMSDAMETTEQEKENEKNQVAVETISGSVLPVDEAAPSDKNVQAAENDGTATESETAGDAALETAEGAAGDAVLETAEGAAGDAALETAGSGQANAEASSTENGQVNTVTQSTDDGQTDTPAAGISADTDTLDGNTVQSEAEIYRSQGYYIVQPGDNLQQISYKIYQTYAMVDAICKANVIDDQNAIYIGQKIILP